MSEMITTAHLSLPLDCVKQASSRPRQRPDAKVGIVPPGSIVDAEKAKAALGTRWSRVVDKENPGMVPVHGGPEDPVAPEVNPPRTVVYQEAGARDAVATVGGRKINTDAAEPKTPAPKKKGRK